MDRIGNMTGQDRKSIVERLLGRGATPESFGKVLLDLTGQIPARTHHTAEKAAKLAAKRLRQVAQINEQAVMRAEPYELRDPQTNLTAIRRTEVRHTEDRPLFWAMLSQVNHLARLSMKLKRLGVEVDLDQVVENASA